MSLVSEALRKARLEAEEQGRPGGARQRFFFSGPGRLDSRLGTGLVLGAIIAFAAAMAGGLVAWWLIGGRQGTVSGQSPVAVEATAGDQPVADTAAESTVADGVADPREPSLAMQPAAADGGEATTGARADGEPKDGGASGRPVDDSSAGETKPPPGLPTAAAKPGGEREFVAVATIGDVTLTLGYLVYRPKNPFVQINGIDVRVGSMIEGFVIDEITRDRVVLHDGDGPVVIRVR